MTDAQFNHAKFKKEQIENNEHLQARLIKAFNNVNNENFDKEEILKMYSDLGEALSALIEVRKQEFKEI
jgi:hypothetical protein